MRRAMMTLALLGSLAAGCAPTPHAKTGAPVAVVVETTSVQTDWRTIATPADRDRIATLPGIWDHARGAVPRRFAARVAAEGPLLDPAAALDLPTLPPGPYLCRLVRLGGRAGFASFAPDFCYVEGDANSLSFTKQTGQNLPGGWLHPDTDKRQVFLGTFRRKAASIAPPYGRDPVHDIAGIVERVAPFRWRLVMTRAGQGALLDIYELVPVPPQVPETPRAPR